MVDLLYCQTNLYFLIFYYYIIIIDFRLSLIFYLSSSGDIYLSLGISLLFSFVTVSELFCCEVFWNVCDFSIFHYYTILISVHQQFRVLLLNIYIYIYIYIYISLGISLSCSFVTVFELFCCELFKTFIVLLANLLPIKLPVTSAV